MLWRIVFFGLVISGFSLINLGCGVVDEGSRYDSSESVDKNLCGDSGKLCGPGTVCLQKVKVCTGECNDQGQCHCHRGSEVRYDEVLKGADVGKSDVVGEVRFFDGSFRGWCFGVSLWMC